MANTAAPWEADAPVASASSAAPAAPWEADEPVAAPKTTASGAASAIATGLNKGVTDVLGLPVDTARNVMELGKAAAGTAYHEATGNDIPDWLQPASPEEQAKTVGSTGWWRQKAADAGAGGFLQPNGEDTTTNRVLSAAGEGVVPGLIGAPAEALPVAAAATAGAAMGAAGQGVGEVTDNPALQTAASVVAGAATGHAVAKATAPKTAAPAAPVPPVAPGGYSPEELHAAPMPERFGGPAQGAKPAPGAEPGPAAPAAPAAPQATAEPIQTGHRVDGNTHTVTTAAGAKLTAVADPEQGTLRVNHAEVPEDARGQGQMVAAQERLNAEAQARGLAHQSDTRVSEPEQNVYAALERRGYPVKENPNTVDPGTGEKVSKSELKPVYEVGPKAAGEAPSAAAEPGAPKAPAPELPVDLSGKAPFSMLSAEKAGNTPEQNAAATAELANQLKAFGVPHTPTLGNYKGSTENSFAVQTPTPGARSLVEGLAKVHGQESVLHVDPNGNSVLRYADGHTEPVGKWGPVEPEAAQGLDSWTRDANGQHYAATPAGVKPKAAPALKPQTEKPVSFEPPTREGAQTGPVPEAQQAEREATLRQLVPHGLKEVRESAITGDTREAGTDVQTSKLTGKTGGGQAGARMAEVIANERAALHSMAEDLVDKSGGTSGNDQIDRERRGRTMTAPIEAYEAHLEDLIKQHYAIATERAQGRPFQLGDTGNILAKEKAQFLGTTEGKQLYEGVMARAKELGLTGANDTFNPATVEQAEQFRQYLNDNWTPRTARLIGRLKGALDLDVAKVAGEDIYKDARDVRSLQGKVLEEPEGVQALRKPDDRLGINRPVDLEDIPKHVAGLGREQLAHLVDVYKMAAKVSPEMAERSAAALNELRAHYANEVLAAGSDSNAPNGAWNVKKVNAYLKQNIGGMSLVHTPEELQQYKVLNDAGNYLRMDRSYPGAVAQGLNLKARAVEGALGHAETVGALLGHIPGAVIGYGLEKMGGKFIEKSLAKSTEARIRRLEPPEAGPPGPNGGGPGETPLGQTAAGKSQSGAIGVRKAGASKSEPMVTLRHFSSQPDLKTINPEMQGTGTRGTNAERNRSTKVSAFYPEKMNAEQPEKLVTQGAPHQYTAQVPKSRLYDAVNDPDNLRKGKSFDAYEAAIKKAGYAGYHVDNPDYPLMHGQARLFESVPATKVGGPGGGPGGKPLGQSAFGKGQRGSVGWHGTPHEFEPEEGHPFGRFRAEKIGTGEGAQVYGHGVYVAENPDVARSYQKVLTMRKGVDLWTPELRAQLPELPTRAQQDRFITLNMKMRATGNLPSAEMAEWHKAKAANTAYDDAVARLQPKGALYHVDVPDEHVAKMLDWDKPVGKQPQVVAALRSLTTDKNPYLRNLAKPETVNAMTGEQLYHAISNIAAGGTGRWDYGHKGGITDRDPRTASAALHQLGIPGVKYLDAGSRGKGEGSRNFVLFDPSIAKIIGKDDYRLPGDKPLPIEEINKHLTPEEQKQTARKNVAANVVNIFHELPPTHELAAAALAGEAKRGWYRNAANAIHTVFGGDAPRFTALLAAMSPQVSVESNFHNAVQTFVNWDAAGRPTDPAKIKAIMGKSVQGDKGEASVLDAWTNNSIRALTHPDPERVPMLSGPKVNSFLQNLRDNVHEVTNDAWMSAFANLNPAKLGGSMNKSGPGKSSAYLAYNAKVRQAAAMLTHLTGEQWTPAEVQETVWSWAKTAYEHADAAGQTKSIPELVKDKDITHDLIRGTSDFHNLFAHPVHAAALRSAGYGSGLEQLHGAQGAAPVEPTASKARASAQRALAPHLMNAAQRLEGVRQQRAAERAGGKPVTQAEKDAIENW